MAIDAGKIVKAIRQTDLTMEDLDLITHMVKVKRESVARTMVRSLQIGDRVQLGDNTRPQYMRGLVGTVTAKKQSKVDVELDERPQGRRFGKKLTVPAELLRPYVPAVVEEPTRPDIYARG